MCATIESIGTVELLAKYCDPNNPFSSAVCQTKSTERLGGLFLNARARASSDTDPEPSSSAPFAIESGVVRGCTPM